MADTPEFLRVTCSACKKRLKVPQKYAGQLVTCPQCSARIRAVSDTSEPKPVPQVKTSSSNDEDDDFKFLDDTKSSSPRPKTSSLLDDLDLSEFDLTDVKPKTKADEFAKSELDAISAALQASDNAEEEFRYSCKVCGTAMYAKMSDVGNMTRCPDCYAEFSIPRPAQRPKKKTTSGPKLDDGAGATLQNSTVDNSRDEKRAKNQADEYLLRAEQDLEKDKKEQKFETYDFDTYGAFEKAFGFLSDPAVWIVAAVPGFFLGCVFVGAQMMGAKLSAQSEQLGSVVSILTLCFLGIPLIAACLANGLAILEASANKQRKVSQWPLYNMGDALGDVVMLTVTIIAAAIPGGVLAWILTSLGAPSIIKIALPLVSMWFLFPLMLLGVLDNGAMTQPYSADVVSSMKVRGDAWGAMYLWNALATLVLFGVLFLMIGRGIPLTILGAILIPFLIYFNFRQIGNLATQIADLTGMSFDEDDEEESDSEASDGRTSTRTEIL